jgi:pimeloyl-ACP methyl ester carboxylesterase
MNGSEGETMGAGCTAVVLHGIFNDKDDMRDLARYLATPGIAPGGTDAYESVWVYDYNYAAPIEDSGVRFASDLRGVLGRGRVDIFGHSMGGLVARWALEQEGLGSTIQRLITLGTPHDGVPLQVLQYILYRTHVAQFGPGINDLVSKVQENPLSLSFLKRLNDGDSPFKSTAQYFTLGGSDYASYRLGNVDIGALINWFYNIGNPGSAILNDGIVAEYSALGEVLANKSAYWNSNSAAHRTVNLNHSQLNGDPEDPIQVVFANEISSWLLPCDPVEAQYEFVRRWGSPGTGDGQLGESSFGIACDSLGFVYVADTSNHRIQKFTPEGEFVTKWGQYGYGNGEFRDPWSIAIDSRDFVYVHDTASSFAPMVQKFDSNGQFVRTLGSYGVGEGQFTGPDDIDVDENDNVYVNDAYVEKFTSGGAGVSTEFLDATWACPYYPHDHKPKPPQTFSRTP